MLMNLFDVYIVITIFLGVFGLLTILAAVDPDVAWSIQTDISKEIGLEGYAALVITAVLLWPITVGLPALYLLFRYGFYYFYKYVLRGLWIGYGKLLAFTFDKLRARFFPRRAAIKTEKEAPISTGVFR